MSNYSVIMGQFRQKLGANEDQQYNANELNRMLDRLVSVNGRQQQFDTAVSAQIYQNTPKVNGSKVNLRDYVNTILRAVQILQKCVVQSQRQLKESKNLQQSDQIRMNLGQYTSDLELISRTFNLPPPVRSKELQGLSPTKQRNSLNESHGSAIFAESPSERQESTTLKIVLIILLLSILFELVLMFVRHHFFNCLVYVFIFGIYLLNFFDKSYVKTCLTMLFVSIILDVVWVIVQSGPYWSNIPSHRSTLRAGFLKFVFLMTIILMVSKTIIMIILYRFRNNNEETRKSVLFLNLKFDLDGRPVASPVYNILNKPVQPRSQT